MLFLLLFEMLAAVVMFTIWVVMQILALLVILLIVLGHLAAAGVHHVRWRWGMRKRAQGRAVELYPPPVRARPLRRVPPRPPRGVKLP